MTLVAKSIKEKLEKKQIFIFEEFRSIVRVTLNLNPPWIFNPFHATGIFLLPLENIKNQKFSERSLA